MPKDYYTVEFLIAFPSKVWDTYMFNVPTSIPQTKEAITEWAEQNISTLVHGDIALIAVYNMNVEEYDHDEEVNECEEYDGEEGAIEEDSQRS